MNNKYFLQLFIFFYKNSIKTYLKYLINSHFNSIC